MVKKDEGSGPGADDEARFIASMKTIREEHGWSQGELAKRMVDIGWASFYQTTISRIEKGERPVRLGEARAIATALGVPISRMIAATEATETLKHLLMYSSKTERALHDLYQAAENVIGYQSGVRSFLEKARGISPETDDIWEDGALSNALLDAEGFAHLDVLEALKMFLEEHGEHSEEA